VESWIELATTPQPFGGRRWWFVCPRTGARVAKLHLPPGVSTFASRRAYRLAYKCQRETPYDRAIRRALKLRRRSGGEYAIHGTNRPESIGVASYGCIRMHNEDITDLFGRVEVGTQVVAMR
jgi:hypothetical protein